MLMYERPENRSSFGHNAKKAWYIGPCLDHYRTFKGILQSTGKERMSDTVKMKHHAIASPAPTSPSPNYISDDDDESQGSEDDDWDIPPSQAISGQGSRRSKRVLSQLRQNEKDGPSDLQL